MLVHDLPEVDSDDPQHTLDADCPCSPDVGQCGPDVVVHHRPLTWCRLDTVDPEDPQLCRGCRDRLLTRLAVQRLLKGVSG